MLLKNVGRNIDTLKIYKYIKNIQIYKIYANRTDDYAKYYVQYNII